MTGPRIFTPEYYARMRALESGAWWNAAMRDVAGGLIRRAGLPMQGTALDVGCGSGQTLDWLLHLRPSWSAVGLDVAADGLRAAKAAGHDVLCGTALSLPLPNESADLVVTLDVLQHLPLAGGDSAALREMRRVLRPGGWLLLRTNAQAIPHTPDDPTADFHKYTVPELRQKLRTSGFAVERLSRINALLGIAEIPREVHARRMSGPRYHGLLAAPTSSPRLGDALKRRWVRLEGRALVAGLPLPFGRTILGLCRAV